MINKNALGHVENNQVLAGTIDSVKSLQGPFTNGFVHPNITNIFPFTNNLVYPEKKILATSLCICTLLFLQFCKLTFKSNISDYSVIHF